MTHAVQLAQQFEAAFNRQELPGMVQLLAPDATAEVLSSGFPVELGPEVIAKTSFPHILGLEEHDAPLRARAWLDPDDGNAYVLLLLGDALDSAVRVLARGGSIERLEYVVRPHQPDEVQRIAARAGVQVL